MRWPSRLELIHASLLLCAAGVVIRAAQVQLWQRGQWSARAQRQQFANDVVPAPRCDIVDVDGVPLAQNRAMLKVSIAPRELRDRAAATRALAAAGVPSDWVRRVEDPGRAWVSLPVTIAPASASALTAMRGVYAEPVIERVYTQREAMRHLVGGIDASGAPVGGLEQSLDSLLRGRAGHALVARDGRGARVEAPGAPSIAPEPGDAVVLTISQELQEIAENALADAVERLGAEGGDIVVLDPEDGEIRAVASRRAGVRAGVQQTSRRGALE